SCPRAALRFRVSQGSGAAGRFTYLLRFTNRTRRTCYMAGFPGVTAVNRHGRQLGSPAAWVAGTPLRVVVLRRGWTPPATLQITDVTAFTRRLCRPAVASGLQVIAPNRVLAKFVRLRFLACSRPGLVYLRVR